MVRAAVAPIAAARTPAKGVMAGKKNKGEAKGQSKRGAGALQSSSVDEMSRRLTGTQLQDEMALQQVHSQQHVATILLLSV